MGVRGRRRDGFLSLGAASIAEYDVRPGMLSPAQSLSMMIAAGIGLHNFSEGLANGQSAASGEISLALVLVIGFGLHNATFFGTLLGQTWVNVAVSITFLALAAGSILYVVIELLGGLRNLGHKTVVAWGLTLGLMLGFATDFVLVAAGV